jgi:hypothetical protein
VLLKKIQHSTIQRALLKDQNPDEKGDDELEDSKSQLGRTLISDTPLRPIDPLQDPKRGKGKGQVHCL